MENTINSFKTVREVEEYRQKMNEECNSRIKFIESVRKANDLSNKSFNYIKECFESLSPELFGNSDGKKLLTRYIDAVKGSRNLTTMQTICEGIRKSGKNTDIDFLLNKLSEDKDIKKSTLKDDVKSIGMILAEAYLLTGEKADELIPTENRKLNSAIDYIIENKCTLKNMSEYSDAIKIIRENIENKESANNVFEARNLDELANELLNEFNKKYSETLNEEESKVLKELASSENREEVFNKYKSLCAENISKAKENFDKKGDKNSSERLSSVLEQVNNKKYSLDTIGEDICNLMELSNIFE